MGLLGGFDRATRGVEADRGVGRGVGGTSGARVSWLASSLASSPRTVAAVSTSTGVPQRAQNRAVDAICNPQDEQNIEGRFYHS